MGASLETAGQQVVLGTEMPRQHLTETVEKEFPNHHLVEQLEQQRGGASEFTALMTVVRDP